ncbi:DUF4397 domain-containing protein [Niabella beijingensis]|nr:DUF4397 domain-containing protein [Niabella beijingensis]MBZ4188177.1 DUF4397 domain-containing protein [Niabella beijingensis]
MTICLTVALMMACKKNVLRTSPYDSVDGKALLKVNYACPYRNNPGVLIKINDQIVSSLVTYTTPYPGGGLNTGGNSYGDYLSVNPGQNKFSLVIPYKGTGRDSVVLYSTSLDLKPNEYQTVHVTDTLKDGSINNTTHVMTTDLSQKPDSGWVIYKFVNLIPNAGPLDLYYGPNKLVSGIEFKQASDTFRLQAGQIQTTGWTIRMKDSTITLGSAYTASAASTVANQRVFTVYARGYAGLPTTDIRNPRVSLLYVK